MKRPGPTAREVTAVAKAMAWTRAVHSGQHHVTPQYVWGYLVKSMRQYYRAQAREYFRLLGGAK